MNLDLIGVILLYAHASFGGLGLFTGSIALIAKKGKTVHKKTGKLFYYAMNITAISALIICSLPGHYNVFLFLVGLFAMYFNITGFRALRLKNKNVNLKVDKLIEKGMVLIGILMILFPIIYYGKLNGVLCVFGATGIVLAFNSLRSFRKPEELRKKWMSRHLGNMIGSYISACTAFIVVNQFIPGVIGWIAPGVVGGFFITYWNFKIRLKNNG